MSARRSVMVDGRPVSFARVLELVPPEDAALCPVVFDVARDLPLARAQVLEAWLRRRGIDAGLAAAAAAPGVSVGQHRRPHGPTPRVEEG